MPEAFISITTSPGPGVGSANSRTSILRLPRNTAPRMSGHLEISLPADPQDFVGIALPPVELREDLHLVEAGVACAFDPAADARQVDHAVAHHAPVAYQIARRHQPVA